METFSPKNTQTIFISGHNFLENINEKSSLFHCSESIQSNPNNYIIYYIYITYPILNREGFATFTEFQLTLSEDNNLKHAKFKKNISY